MVLGRLPDAFLMASRLITFGLQSHPVTQSAHMQRKDLTKPLAEVVLIVVSVFLAFGAQAQWEGRQERRQRAAHIDAVIAELEVNREVVRSHLELTQDADSAARRMVEIAYGDVPRPSSEIRVNQRSPTEAPTPPTLRPVPVT